MGFRQLLRDRLSGPRRTLRLHRAVWALPPKAPPGHYYSPLTSHEDAERAAAWIDDEPYLGDIDLDWDAMEQRVEQLAPMWADVPLDRRYHRDMMYELADAAVYSSIIRHVRPRRILEVGSGYSTALALDTFDAEALDTELACIEPHPERLNALLRPGDRVELHRSIVQDVPLDLFDRLDAGDILFLDSTHVVKPGSDVVFTTLRVLPRLKPGVLVHIHDMFWPFEYKANWLRNRRDWNEIYLVRAFLSGNQDWSVWLFNDLVWQRRPDLVARYRPETLDHRPGGLWLYKTPDAQG